MLDFVDVMRSELGSDILSRIGCCVTQSRIVEKARLIGILAIIVMMMMVMMNVMKQEINVFLVY